MFTMGHKALVLNKLRAEDTISGLTCKINGYCNFLLGDANGNVSGTGTAFSAASTTGTLAGADFTCVVPNGLQVGDSVEVRITFKQNRYVSEYTSDFIKQGDTLIFQSIAVVTADAAGIATAIVQGWINYLNVFMLGATPPITVAAGAAAGDIAVNSTVDYINIESVKIKNVPYGAKLEPAMDSILAPLTATLQGLEAVGAGKFLEESIRTANYTNMDPYANKPHGSDSVDVRGTYALYEFEAGNGGGWEPHEHLGTAIADQSVTAKPQKFTVYANEDDALLIAALDAWIAAVIAA